MLIVLEEGLLEAGPVETESCWIKKTLLQSFLEAQPGLVEDRELS